MNQREITRDILAALPVDSPATTRSIAKAARRRNADVCAVLRSLEGMRVYSDRSLCTVKRIRTGPFRGYLRSSSPRGFWMQASVDRSNQFAEVIAEVEADSRFGLFLGVEERAG